MDGLDLGKFATQFKEIQSTLTKTKVEGSSESGGIKIILNGQQDVLAVRLFPQILGTVSKSKLEQDIVTVFNQTIERSKDKARKEINSIIGVDMSQFNQFF